MDSQTQTPLGKTLKYRFWLSGSIYFFFWFLSLQAIKRKQKFPCTEKTRSLAYQSHGGEKGEWKGWCQYEYSEECSREEEAILILFYMRNSKLDEKTVMALYEKIVFALSSPPTQWTHIKGLWLGFLFSVNYNLSVLWLIVW